MTCPALTRLVEHHRLPVLTLENFEAWTTAREHALLFFAGDTGRFLESSDVAVILPELLNRFGSILDGALIDPSAERELQARYRFDAWPALVLLRHGQFLGTITRIRSWAEYVSELESLLIGETKPVPGFRIPVVSAPKDPCH